MCHHQAGHPCLPVSTQAPPRCKTPSTLVQYLSMFAGRYVRKTTSAQTLPDLQQRLLQKEDSKKNNPSSRQPYPSKKNRNQQQHDLHARPRWMQEWSYAEVQNPKPFVITVALILSVHLCTSGDGHNYTMCDASFVRLWRRDVDLKIASGTAAHKLRICTS